MSEMGFSWTLYVVDQCINVCQSLIVLITKCTNISTLYYNVVSYAMGNTKWFCKIIELSKQTIYLKTCSYSYFSKTISQFYNV